MPKRKDTEDVVMGEAQDTEMKDRSGEDSDSDDSMSIVNVSFEMFDPQPAHDFHSLRALLRQLFGPDAKAFDLSALTDLVLSQPLLGTTVKTDGNESDAYAFLTVLNLREHGAHAAVAPVVGYLKRHANGPIRALLEDGEREGGDTTVGLILTERLLNMPVEIVPPMYRMLEEEIQWAVDEGEPYAFTHFLIVSKTYTEVASALDPEERATKRKWGKAASKAAKKKETFYYHPEDEVIVKRVEREQGKEWVAGWEFEGDAGASDSRRTFGEMGIAPRGLMVAVGRGGWGGVVEELEGLFKA